MMVYLGAAVVVNLLPAAGELLLYVPLLSTAVTVQRYVVLADRPSSVVVVPFTSFVFSTSLASVYVTMYPVALVTASHDKFTVVDVTLVADRFVGATKGVAGVEPAGVIVKEPM